MVRLVGGCGLVVCGVVRGVLGLWGVGVWLVVVSWVQKWLRSTGAPSEVTVGCRPGRARHFWSDMAERPPHMLSLRRKVAVEGKGAEGRAAPRGVSLFAQPYRSWGVFSGAAPVGGRRLEASEVVCAR